MNIHKPTALICTIMQISMQLSRVSSESFALRHKTGGRGECFMRNFCSSTLWNVAAVFSNIHFSTYKAYWWLWGKPFYTSYPVCLELRPVLSLWVSTSKCTMMLISQFFDQPVFVLLAVIFLPPTCLNEIQWLNECSLYGQWCRGLLNDMDISVVWWFWMRSRGCLTSTEPATKRPMALIHERRIKKDLDVMV